MSTIERCFTLTQTVSDMCDLSRNLADKRGDFENHYGIKWLLVVSVVNKHLSVGLYCQPQQHEEWTIKVDVKFEITSSDGRPYIKYGCCDLNEKEACIFDLEFIEWPEIIKKYIKNDRLEVKCHVTIKSFPEKTANRKPLKLFDKSMEKYSDVIVKVDGRDFYVSKLALAMQSSYFEGLFLGSFVESTKSEIELKGVDAEDFQDYLNLIFTNSPVFDDNLEKMLELGDMFNTPMVMERCKIQLLNEKSSLTLKDKLRLSRKFRLEDVVDYCIGKYENAQHGLTSLSWSPTTLFPSSTTFAPFQHLFL